MAPKEICKKALKLPKKKEGTLALIRWKQDKRCLLILHPRKDLIWLYWFASPAARQKSARNLLTEQTREKTFYKSIMKCHENVLGTPWEKEWAHKGQDKTHWGSHLIARGQEVDACYKRQERGWQGCIDEGKSVVMASSVRGNTSNWNGMTFLFLSTSVAM